MNGIEKESSRLGLYVSAYSPGDGITRYRFYTTPKRFFHGDGIFTALGKREALIFLRGIEIGRMEQAKLMEGNTK